jgi:hypothetical protein
MCLLRRKWPRSRLQPEFRFIRTLQSPHHLIFDERTGRYHISSQAFTPSGADGALSGDLEQILLVDGLSTTAMYPAVRDPVGAASVTIGQIREANATVEHDPVKWNWYHGAVRGSKARSVRKRLSEVAIEIIRIDQIRAAELEAAWKANRADISST